MNKFFTLLHQDKNSDARTGVIHTDHGDIQTPIFMPVGTQATVKSVDQDDLRALEAQIILGNNYHLHLRPGEELIAQAGGLHKFMRWNRPILTDSGGFQVFSLGKQKEAKEKDETANKNQKLVSIDEDGVTFRSHHDGSPHRFTPESAIEIQHKIGADIIMAFDECTPDSADEAYTVAAMERTHRWAKRCLDAHKNLNIETPSENAGKPGYPDNYRRFLFGIIQGANHQHLREASAKYISSLDFDGIAIGGESIGYNMAATANILDWVNPHIPPDKPHYTMGVGYSPADLFAVVERGVDMFDCVAPTRIARNGALFVHRAINPSLKININNAQFRTDFGPIDPLCTCYTCTTYSRAYVHHLFRTEELLAFRLATLHNLHFFIDLMRQMREAINEDLFVELKKEWLGEI